MDRLSEHEALSSLSRSAASWSAELWAAEEYAKDYTIEVRRELAKKGWALPDGSYPIKDAGDLKDAATLAASGHGNVSAAKALIRKRAGELGVKLDSLPGFGSESSASVPDHDKAVTGLIQQAVKAQEAAPDPDDPNDKAVMQHLRNAAAAQDADNKGHAGGKSY